MFEGVHGTHGKFKVMEYQRGPVRLCKIYCEMFRGNVKGGEGSGTSRYGKMERGRQSRGRFCVSRTSQYACTWMETPGSPVTPGWPPVPGPKESPHPGGC